MRPSKHSPAPRKTHIFGWVISLLFHSLLFAPFIWWYLSPNEQAAGPLQMELWTEGNEQRLEAPTQSTSPQEALETTASIDEKNEASQSSYDPVETPLQEDKKDQINELLLAQEALKQAETERLEQERIAKEKAEAERLAAEKQRQEALAKAKAERIEKERLEQERIAKEKAEAERLAAEKQRQEALAKAEAERIEKERLEQERIAKEKAEAKRLAAEKQRQEALAKAKAERIEKERLEQERIAKEKAEAERLAAEKQRQEALAKAKAERIAKEKARQEKIKKEKERKLRIAKEKAAAKAKRAKEAKLRAKKQAEEARIASELSDIESMVGIQHGRNQRNQVGGGGGSNAYIRKVQQCIEPRLVYHGSRSMSLTYQIQLDAFFEIEHVRITRSSGSPNFDKAARAAIMACKPFPIPPNNDHMIKGVYRYIPR